MFTSPTGSLPYRLHRPASAHSAQWRPLVLLLHGAGERGSDNERSLVHGTADFACPTRQSREPSFVVVPQCPDDEVWASIDRTDLPTKLASRPSRPLTLVLELLQSLLDHEPIDPQRVYLTGLSMGGYGTWDLLQRRPQLFAAAIPICGGADVSPTWLEPIRHIPLWIFHGEADTVVPVQRSREVVGELRRLGAIPRYTEYSGGDHDSWTETYQNSAVLDWLFAQTRRTASQLPPVL